MTKKLLFLLALPVAVFVAVALHGGTVHAQQPFNQPANTGYFNGNYTNAGNLKQGYNLFTDGTKQSDVEAFIKHYQDKLYGTDNKEKIGAAFTILTMLGYSSRTSYTVAQDRFNDWATIIRYYGSQGWITWDSKNTYYYNYNTYYFPEAAPSLGDVAWYDDGNSQSSIVFWNPGGQGSYAIKRDCGNPVGDLNKLVDKPAVVVHCGVLQNVDPIRPEVGDNVTVTVTVTYTNGPPVKGPSGGQIIISGKNVGLQPGYPRDTGGSTYTMVSNTFPVNSPGTYAVSWTLNVDDTPPTNPGPMCGGDLTTPGDTFTVYTYPFLTVAGGDMAAGARFATTPGASCTEGSDRNAGIVSWNKGAPNYNGASNQYGMFAFNYIQDVVGNKGNGNSASSTSLSFANEHTRSPDAINPPNGLFGGFNSSGPCVDAWMNKPTNGTSSLPSSSSVDIGTLASGTYVVGPGAKLTINSSANPNLWKIANQTHITIYVDGDVSIAHDIVDATTSWGTLGDIPSFKLVVKGSIYVDAGVSELDGNYIAVPDTGYSGAPNNLNSLVKPIKGTISTCSNGFAAISPATSPAPVVACNNTLSVYGTFSANQIFFLRTKGSMNNGTAAEQFYLSPDDWLSPGGSGPFDPAYKSIVGLPPVL